MTIKLFKKKKTLRGPFQWVRFNCLKATELKRGSLLFTTKLSEIPDTQFGRPRKNERLSHPWSRPVVLNTGPLEWESSALTTRPLIRS